MRINFFLSPSLLSFRSFFVRSVMLLFLFLLEVNST